MLLYIYFNCSHYWFASVMVSQVVSKINLIQFKIVSVIQNIHYLQNTLYLLWFWKLKQGSACISQQNPIKKWKPKRYKVSLIPYFDNIFEFILWRTYKYYIWINLDTFKFNCFRLIFICSINGPRWSTECRENCQVPSTSGYVHRCSRANRHSIRRYASFSFYLDYLSHVCL